jgi:hypothetical protein
MTATSILLDDIQRQQLSDAYAQCLAKPEGQLGAWREAYELLYGFLTTTTLGVDFPRTDVDPQTWLWLKGARFVNSGEGAFGALIRDYTKAQFKQRYGGNGAVLSDAQANKASNQIAKSFIGQWLGLNSANSYSASQPNLNETGIFDAGAAASKVFGAENTDDPDNAAGWAGIVLFPNLGAPDFYRKLIVDGLKFPTTTASYSLPRPIGGPVTLSSVIDGRECNGATNWPWK